MLERFLPRDLYLLARDPAFGAPIDFAALFFIIEREISVLLKNADLAHPLRTDAAGSDICDTAILKSHPRVRDIFAAAQDRHTDSVDGLHGRAHEVQNNLEIVNHEIEHDADVRAAFRIRREPVRFDKARMRQSFLERA